MIKSLVYSMAISFLGVITISAIYYIAKDNGSNEAFNKIILEECWLNKQSRDIECITYMGD